MAIFSRLVGEMLTLGGAENIGLCNRCWRFMFIEQYTKQYCSPACRASSVHDDNWLAASMQAIEQVLSAFNFPLKRPAPRGAGPVTLKPHPLLANPFRRRQSPAS